MAILTFSARAVAAQIAHARTCSTFLPNWDGPVGTPALILIVGNGVGTDLEAEVETHRRILAYAAQHPTVYLPSHDPDASRRLAGRITLDPHGKAPARAEFLGEVA